MRITFSEIIQDSENNGARLVIEKHTYNNGSVYLHTYSTVPATNIESVMNQRAANMNAELQRRDDEAALAANFEIPLSKIQFRDRFTATEQLKIDNFNATYQSNPALTAEQKASILSGLAHYNDTPTVYLSHALTISMVNLYDQLGLLDNAGRVSEILS